MFDHARRAVEGVRAHALLRALGAEREDAHAVDAHGAALGQHEVVDDERLRRACRLGHVLRENPRAGAIELDGVFVREPKAVDGADLVLLEPARRRHHRHGAPEHGREDVAAGAQRVDAARALATRARGDEAVAREAAAVVFPFVSRYPPPPSASAAMLKLV